MTHPSSSNSKISAEHEVISIQAVEAYRAKSYLQDRGLATVEQAIKFVQERGFVFFWPIKGIDFPSLWTAVAGNRPVANEHDDPGHVTWGWKDQMLGKRQWYYAKMLRKKATLISLEVAPFFYALELDALTRTAKLAGNSTDSGMAMSSSTCFSPSSSTNTSTPRTYR